MTKASLHILQAKMRRLARWVSSVLFYEHWMVGFVDQPIANAPTWKKAPAIRWLMPFEKHRYLADPFPWPNRPDRFLCEEYDTRTRQGHLIAVSLNASGIAAEQKLNLPLQGHLSFPFSFAHKGHIYLLPESSIDGRLCLFRWHEEAWQWDLISTLFENRPVADAAFFEKDGLLWISFTDVSENHHNNLHLMFASDLGGPWQQHPANPVQTGVQHSRNGGAVFQAGGRLYRPAQDCSTVYGGALRIMEIITCTPQAYVEKEVTYIAPSSRDYPHGFHTITAFGDKCLVDGMRLTFSCRLLCSKIARRLFRWWF